MEHAAHTATKPKRKRRAIEFVLIAVIVICVGIIGVIGAQYFLQAQSYSKLSDEVSVVGPEASGGDLAKMSVDWEKLREESPDVVGWVIMPDTVIDYPIVQGPDNEYYLHRSYDGSATWASTGGTIFLDANNKADFSDSNNVLYGHHMNDGSMFASLADLTNQDNFDANRTIYVLTPTMNYRLETFACVLTTGDDAIVQTNFATAERFAAYVQDKMDRSVVDASSLGISAKTVGKMFMLVTCEYSQNDGRECLCAVVAEQAAPLS